MPVTALPKELRRLEAGYQLIRREAPIGDEAGRLGRYRLAEPFLRFWFPYVYPFQRQLEAGRHDRVLAVVRRDLPALEGWTLEALVRDRVARGDPGLALPIEAEVDLDVIGRERPRGTNRPPSMGPTPRVPPPPPTAACGSPMARQAPLVSTAARSGDRVARGRPGQARAAPRRGIETSRVLTAPGGAATRAR